MNKDDDFVNEFKSFYKNFFECVANSVDYLGEIQKKYPKQYEQIIQFEENPENLETLIEDLSIEKQAILLRVLLKAGDFGRKFINLMNMSAKEKKTFATDLKEFAENIEKM